MDEREFFNETTEQRTHNLTCPKCGQAAEYKVTWIVRRKRAQLPRGGDERDRARFAKAQSYMVRRDDKLQCANIRCRKPFEITSLQIAGFPHGLVSAADFTAHRPPSTVHRTGWRIPASLCLNRIQERRSRRVS